MSQKIQLVVFNEHTLGYKEPEWNFLMVLHASVFKGAPWSLHNCDRKYIDPCDSVRLATEKDFEDFKIVIDGYKKDPKYEYDRKN